MKRDDRPSHLRLAFRDGNAVSDRVPARTPIGAGACVADIMMSPAITIGENGPITEAVALFVRAGIGAVPVVDRRGQLTGVLTKTDLVRLMHECAVETSFGTPDASASVAIGSLWPTSMRVNEVMTEIVFAVPSDALVVRAAALMAYEHVHHAVVHTSGGELAGIVSSLDIMDWFARCAGVL